jgi:hypothetical protein
MAMCTKPTTSLTEIDTLLQEAPGLGASSSSCYRPANSLLPAYYQPATGLLPACLGAAGRIQLMGQIRLLYHKY